MGHSVPAPPVVSPCERVFLPTFYSVEEFCCRRDTTGCHKSDQPTISHRMDPLVTVAPTCAVRFLTVPLR
jgi:hypothetical protein